MVYKDYPNYNGGIIVMVDISSYNKVISYLPSSKVNIHYLNSFEDGGIDYITSTTSNATPYLTSGLEHDIAYGLNGVSDFIINFDDDVKEVRLDNFEKIEFTVSSTEDFGFEDIKLVFSRTPNCVLSYLEIGAFDLLFHKEEQPNSTYLYNLCFMINNELDLDWSKILLDIASVKVKFPKESDIVIYNAVARQTIYNLGIKEIDEQYKEAELYIIRKIHEDTVPPLLKSALCKITSAYLWWGKWYEEGQKSATLGEFSTMSYGDKLMESANDDIDRYNKDKGEDENRRYLDARWIGSR